MKTELTARINACWQGKAIGGTLGIPHEGKTGPLNLEFYDPQPTGVLPNDGLDLQIVWLHHLLETKAAEVTPNVLTGVWRRHVMFPFDELGVCLRNIAYGMRGSSLGAADNWFAECMGAAIRSELWACISPGDLERVASFAWNDAICDHAGDGGMGRNFSGRARVCGLLRNRSRALVGYNARLPAKRKPCKTPSWSSAGGGKLNRTGHPSERRFIKPTATIISPMRLPTLPTQCSAGLRVKAAMENPFALRRIAVRIRTVRRPPLDPYIPARWSAPIGNKIVPSPQIVEVPIPPTLEALTQSTLHLADQLQGHRPKIGDVLPRHPSSAGNSPVTLLLRENGSEHHALFAQTAPPPHDTNAETKVLPGHWLQRESQDFQHSVTA